MIEASHKDKTFIVDLLSRAFDDNKSVNYVLPQDRRRRERIRHLMSYSFEVCHRFGKVYLSEEGRGCAMILFPEQQKTDLSSLVLDFKLITRSIGLSHVRKAMNRESAIKNRHPQELLYYLWFIGVEHGERGKGIGSALLNGIIQEAGAMNRTICLETSAPKNLPWYQKAGFSIYDELDLGYTLYFLKKNNHP
jgi:GNAT superfamily N-acetyltransferase